MKKLLNYSILCFALSFGTSCTNQVKVDKPEWQVLNEIQTARRKQKMLTEANLVIEEVNKIALTNKKKDELELKFFKNSLSSQELVERSADDLVQSIGVVALEVKKELSQNDTVIVDIRVIRSLSILLSNQHKQLQLFFYAFSDGKNRDKFNALTERVIDLQADMVTAAICSSL